VDSGDEPVDNSGEDTTTEGVDSDPAADSSGGPPDSSTGDGVDDGSTNRCVIIPVLDNSFMTDGLALAMILGTTIRKRTLHLVM
jgi:hypothetical protein